ncbi:hypothetical protein [Clostridium ihumii]|nr:hypothetical protein [Clostridium ihumii]
MLLHDIIFNVVDISNIAKVKTSAMKKKENYAKLETTNTKVLAT